MSNIPTLIAQIEKALQQIENKENIDFNKAIIRSACIDMFHSVEKLGLEKGEYPIPNLRFDTILMEEPTTIETFQNQETVIITPPAETVVEETAPSSINETIIESKTEAVIEQVPTTENVQNNDIQVPLVEKLNKAKEPAVNVVDKQKETPIADLSKAISISKKFEFINALFDSQAELYKNSIQTIQEANSYEDASQFIDSSLSNQFNWNEQEKLAAEFFSLVRRRFL